MKKQTIRLCIIFLMISSLCISSVSSKFSYQEKINSRIKPQKNLPSNTLSVSTQFFSLFFPKNLDLGDLLFFDIAPFLTLDRSVIIDHKAKIEITNMVRTRSCKVFYDGILLHDLGPGKSFNLESRTEYSLFLRRPGSFSRRMARKISNRYPIR